MRLLKVLIALAVALAGLLPSRAGADDVQPLLDKGRFTPQQSQSVRALLDRADRRALPVPVLTNRIREGIARRVEPKAILSVLQDRLADLERADDVVRKCAQHGIVVRERERSLVRLADSFTQGVTPGDMDPVIPAALQATSDLESVALAAEILGRLDRKGFRPSDTRDIVAAAVAAGWSPERMSGLLGLLLEADALHMSPGEVRGVLVDGIREKKDPSGLADKMRRAAEDEGRGTGIRERR